VKIFALTFGGPDTPSTHFRIHQYAEAFAAEGVTIEHAVAKEFEDFKRLADYDVVLHQKALIRSSKFRRIRKHAKTLVYDADDRMWMRPGKPYGPLTRARLQRRLKTIARASDLCIAANGVIAADQSAAGAKRVEVLPMSVDTGAWNAEGRPEPDGTVTIGWSGSPGNLAFLEPLVPTLRALEQEFEQVRIAIHCGQRPEFDGLEFTHHPFEPGLEPEAVRTFDVGLLPLPNDPFVAGKSPIKALQYFACGAAVVGQDVGATAELLTQDVNALTVTDERTWATNLRRLVEDGALRARLVAAGHEKIEREHTMSAVVARYLDLLHGAAGIPRTSAGAPRA